MRTKLAWRVSCNSCGDNWRIPPHVSYPLVYVCPPCRSRQGDGADDGAALAAFADGPVSDTPEPVTPQAGIVGAEPDRDDGHTMPHV